MENDTLLMLVGIASAVSAIVFAFIGYKRGVENRSRAEGSKDGSIETNIQYIRSRVDQMLIEQKDTNKVINGITERIIRLEEATKSAHKRLDVLTGKGSGYD